MSRPWYGTCGTCGAVITTHGGSCPNPNCPTKTPPKKEK